MMIPYIAALLLSVCVCWVTTYPGRSKKISCAARIVLIALPLFVISAFRYNIGTDYVNYVGIFEHLKAGDYYRYYGDKTPEPLYLLLNYILIFLNANPQWLFIITTTIYTGLIVYTIVKYSPNPCLSLFLMFGTTAFFEQMNTMRAHMAYAILMIALINFLEGKNKKFIIYCVTAGLFHYTALVFLILMLLLKIEIKPKTAIVIIVACYIGSKPLSIFAKWIIQLTPYGLYLDRLVVSSTAGWGLIIQTFIFVFMTIFYKKDDKVYNAVYLLEVITLILTIFTEAIPLIARLRWIFYYPVVLFGIPIAVKNISKNYIRVATTICIVLAFSAYTFIMVVINQGNGVYPYQWIF